jgi:hypothetical protein
MLVDADFSLLRRDIDAMKEWSIDIASTWFSNSQRIDFQLHLLIECKYRSPEKFVLLVPDPNEKFPPGTLGGTVNILDQLSKYHLSSEPFTELERGYEFVYKGIEIHSGGASDEDLRHGIQQLRYATPAYLKQLLEFSMGSHPEDRRPEFFAKILVTNAPLRLLKRKSSIGDIRAASTIDDVSIEIDSAILFSDYGPDYEDHFRLTFKNDRDRLAGFAREISEELRTDGKQLSGNTDPVRLVESFSSASRYECRNVSTQFYVTTLKSLPRLLRAIRSACKASYKLRTKVDRKAVWLQKALKRSKRNA